jgi:hypothetical protein
MLGTRTNQVKRKGKRKTTAKAKTPDETQPHIKRQTKQTSIEETQQTKYKHPMKAILEPNQSSPGRPTKLLRKNMRTSQATLNGSIGKHAGTYIHGGAAPMRA